MEILFSAFGFDARYRNSAAEMNPFPSLSNTRNASRISSSLSVSFILRAIIVRNSGKSIVPLPENHLKNEVSIRRKKNDSNRQRRLRWSCLEARLQLDFVPNFAWRFLKRESKIASCFFPRKKSWKLIGADPILWLWLFHRRPCRKEKKPLWIQRFVLQLVDRPFENDFEKVTFSIDLEEKRLKFVSYPSNDCQQ